MVWVYIWVVLLLMFEKLLFIFRRRIWFFRSPKVIILAWTCFLEDWKLELKQFAEENSKSMHLWAGFSWQFNSIQGNFLYSLRNKVPYFAEYFLSNSSNSHIILGWEFYLQRLEKILIRLLFPSRLRLRIQTVSKGYKFWEFWDVQNQKHPRRIQETRRIIVTFFYILNK